MPSKQDRQNVLFICTANSERSPTAEELLQNSAKYKALSAGVHPLAKRVVDQELIDWADWIFVMSERQDRHASILKQSFELGGKKIHDLDIPDLYPYGTPELIQILRERLATYLDLDV